MLQAYGMHPRQYSVISVDVFRNANRARCCTNNEWAGLNGPNITSVSVKIGADSMTTSYGFRSYTTRFGKFARHNSNALKRVAQQKEIIVSAIRAQLSAIHGTNMISGKNKTARKYISKHKNI